MATHNEFRAWYGNARAARRHNDSIDIGKFCRYGIAERARLAPVGHFHGYELPFILDPLEWVARHRRNAADYLARKRGKSTPNNPYPIRDEYDFRRKRAMRPCVSILRLRMIESAIRMEATSAAALSAWRVAA